MNILAAISAALALSYTPLSATARPLPLPPSTGQPTVELHTPVQHTATVRGLLMMMRALPPSPTPACFSRLQC